MNSVIVAKATKSVIPSFENGELVTSANRGVVIMVTSCDVRADYFRGIVLFSKDPYRIGLTVVVIKADFELFSEVLELAN